MSYSYCQIIRSCLEQASNISNDVCLMTGPGIAPQACTPWQRAAAGGAWNQSTWLATHQAVGAAAVMVVEGAVVLSGGPHPPLERALLPAPGHIAAHDQQPALDGTADARDFAGNSARNASLHRRLQKLQAGDSPACSVWGLAAYLAAKFNVPWMPAGSCQCKPARH